MDWIIFIYGGTFFFGVALSIAKLFYTFQRKTRGYTNLCIQYKTGACIFVYLLGTLGILAAQLSNASGEVGVDIFLFTVLVYVITAVSLCFISMALEMSMSLLRKAKIKVLLRCCLGLIVLLPISTSGMVRGISGGEARMMGTHVLSAYVILSITLSSIFLVAFLRKAKLLAIAIFPICDQQYKEAGNVVSNMPKDDIKVLPESPAEVCNESNNNTMMVRQSLKSSLKKTENGLREAVHRSVCFLIGKETEVWRKEKEIRRIEKERDKALLFIILLLCYSVCFLPFCSVLLYHGTFSLQILACRITYALATLFAIVEPIVYLLYMNCVSGG